MKAYVFVTTTTVNPAQVAQQIRQIPGIKAADLCWGQPDIMAVAESADAHPGADVDDHFGFSVAAVGDVNQDGSADLVVGAPNANTISAGNGDRYIPWLQTIHPGAHGNADLSAHFFRRADSLLGRHGTVGLVATNTIAQGDTRESALKPMVMGGHRLYAATRSRI